MAEHCPMCGHPVEVVSGSEGTNSYRPIEADPVATPDGECSFCGNTVEATPLDVERLARAMTQSHFYPQPPRNKFGADTPYDMAAAIAAAYEAEGQPVAEEPA